MGAPHWTPSSAPDWTQHAQSDRVMSNQQGQPVLVCVYFLYLSSGPELVVNSCKA